MCERGLLMIVAQCFKILLEIPSYPKDFFVFNASIVLSTSFSVIGITFISVYSVLLVLVRSS